MDAEASHCENCGMTVQDFVPQNASEMFLAKQMYAFKEVLTANNTGEEGKEKLGTKHSVTAKQKRFLDFMRLGHRAAWWSQHDMGVGHV